MLLPLLFVMVTRIGPESASVPYRQPQLAAAHGQVVMTFGAGSTIFFTASTDQGKTFAPPIKVADVPALALGRHRGPRVAVLEKSIVISAIAGEKKGDGDLVTFRSTDRGASWIRAGVVNDVPNAAREGLHAMAADSKGRLFTVWLDLRGKGTKLYGARSTDGGLTWSRNELVYASPDGTICQCCDPSISIDEQDRVWVMWRNALDGSRDLWVTNSADGIHFEAARKLGDGTWKLNACPMDGGGLAVDHGQVTSAWRRESDVYLAEAGKPERKVGTGKDVAMTRTKTGTFVAWTNGGGIEVVTPNLATPEQLAAAGAFVTLTPLPDGTALAAWEAHDGIETSRIDPR